MSKGVWDHTVAIAAEVGDAAHHLAQAAGDLALASTDAVAGVGEHVLGTIANAAHVGTGLHHLGNVSFNAAAFHAQEMAHNAHAAMDALAGTPHPASHSVPAAPPP